MWVLNLRAKYTEARTVAVDTLPTAGQNGGAIMRHVRLIPLTAALSAAMMLAACSSSEASFPVRIHPMGERVELGHIIYTVFETQWMTHMGEGPLARVPQNRFFLVRMSAVNSGGGDVMIPNLTIQDDNGNAFTEMSNGDGVPQWMGFLRSVKPADTAQGNIVFDAPPRHYKLRITDESGERAALVDIPLSFGAETPEVLIPGDAKK